MDRRKQAKLRTRGWTISSATDFLDLSQGEARYIELKLALSSSLRHERQRLGLTQLELATLLGSSQSRIAKMEAGDPSVSADLLLKALLSLGLTNQQVAKIIA